MADLSEWLSEKLSSDTPTVVKAIRAWQHIQQKPSTIVIRRHGVTLSPQVCRIEHNLRVREELRENATMGVSIAVVFGTLGHPDHSDLDIKPRDRFIVAGTEFEVTTVIAQEGEIQAVCESRFP